MILIIMMWRLRWEREVVDGDDDEVVCVDDDEGEG